MFLLVGLGNPGSQYDDTRHNVGFMLLDEIAREAGASLGAQKFRGQFGRGRWEGHDAAFLKPLTYMNVSGSSVQEALAFFKIPIEKLIVLFDDLDQEPGAVRIRSGGGHGGHNGVRDILAKCGGDAFHRVKIGIGKPVHKTATADYVLGRFSQEERDRLDKESFPLVKGRMRDLMYRLAKG